MDIPEPIMEEIKKESTQEVVQKKSISVLDTITAQFNALPRRQIEDLMLIVFVLVLLALLAREFRTKVKHG